MSFDSNMKASTFITFSATLFICSGSAIADCPMDFVRITCIPEARYFWFDYTSIDCSAVLSGVSVRFDDKKRSQRMSAWEKQGYYRATNLQYECRLPESTYKISAVQPPEKDRGICGAAPQITLSLFRNGTPILDQIIFGNDCFGGPTVVSAEITDGLQKWNAQKMTLCLSPKSDAPKVCEYFSGTGAISQAIPINQERVGEYVKNTANPVIPDCSIHWRFHHGY